MVVAVNKNDAAIRAPSSVYGDFNHNSIITLSFMAKRFSS